MSRGAAGGAVFVASVQQPQTVEPPSPDDTFRDLVDVAGIAVPLAAAVLLGAITWPGVRRWFRHRMRRHRRRKRHQPVPTDTSTVR